MKLHVIKFSFMWLETSKGPFYSALQIGDCMYSSSIFYILKHNTRVFKFEFFYMQEMD